MELRYAGAIHGETKRDKEISSKEAGRKVNNEIGSKESACKKGDHKEVNRLFRQSSPLA